MVYKNLATKPYHFPLSWASLWNEDVYIIFKLNCKQDEPIIDIKKEKGTQGKLSLRKYKRNFICVCVK